MGEWPDADLPSGLWKCPNLRELSCQGSQLVHRPPYILVHCKCKVTRSRGSVHADHIGESSDWPNEASDLITSRPLPPAALLALRDHTHPYTPVSPQAFLPSGRERGTIAPRSSTFSCRYARTRTRTRGIITRARNHSTSSSQNHSRSKSWSLVSSFGNHQRKGQRQRYPLTWSRICTLQSAALSARGMSLAILSATWPCGTEVVADGRMCELRPFFDQYFACWSSLESYYWRVPLLSTSCSRKCARLIPNLMVADGQALPPPSPPRYHSDEDSDWY